MEHKWITVRTAAAILNKAPNTIRKRINDGLIPKLGVVDGRIIVLDGEYIRYLAAKEKGEAA